MASEIIDGLVIALLATLCFSGAALIFSTLAEWIRK